MKNLLKKENTMKIIIIVAGIIGIIGLFLPYEKSIGSHKNYLKEYPDTTYLEEVNYTNKDVINISILENFKVYSYSINHNEGSSFIKTEAIINVIITITMIISIILILLFAILNKKVLTIIFDIVLAISSILMNYDIVSRGVIPSSKYTYGISYYLYIILAIIILVSNIILIIQNKKAKKKNN